MKFSAINTPRLDWLGDALAIGFFEEQVELTGDLAELDRKLGDTLAELIAENEFKGKQGSSIMARVGGGSAIRKVIGIGLGKQDAFKLDGIRQAAGTAAKLAKNQKCLTLGISLPVLDDAATTAQAIVEGVELALHKDTRFKSESEESNAELQQVDLLGLGEISAPISLGQQMSEGVKFARELVNAPANTCTPVAMAEMAQDLATEYGFEIEILEKADCEKLGMGSFLGVAQASDLPPKFIHMTYQPQGTTRRKLAIVGKGLTFDSGGLNLKVNGGIETMKIDMGGAAATFGAAKAIGLIKPDVEVHFISAVTENMISGHAMHPGDILTASNGKTIEVNNTDAEGRLTLADALVFADKLGVDAIVDLATLTGACVVALGEDIAGLWSPDDPVANQLLAASEKGGEKLWRMPLEEKYFEGLKALHADMKNTGPRAGGSITAALFLKQFVDKTPWAHLDIAGPVWTDKDKGYNPAGGTGFAVRTLVNWVLGE